MDIIMVLAMPMAATNSETAPMPPRTACIMLDCCFVLSIQSAAIKYPYWNKAFDAKAGFSIRPVYIKK